MFQHICTYLTNSAHPTFQYAIFYPTTMTAICQKSPNKYQFEILIVPRFMESNFQPSATSHVKSCSNIRKICIPEVHMQLSEIRLFFNRGQQSIMKSFTNQGNKPTYLKLTILSDNEDLLWRKSRLYLKLHHLHAAWFMLLYYIASNKITTSLVLNARLNK